MARAVLKMRWAIASKQKEQLNLYTAYFSEKLQEIKSSFEKRSPGERYSLLASLDTLCNNTEEILGPTEVTGRPCDARREGKFNYVLARKIRKGEKLSLKELARQLGFQGKDILTAAETVRRYEKGKYAPGKGSIAQKYLPWLGKHGFVV